MRKEHGSIIIYLLAAIALIGALTASIMFGNTYDNTDREQVRLNLDIVRSYGSDLTHAITRVKSRSGCREDQISFAHPSYVWYNNVNAPADKSCHIFDPNGGGVDFKVPPSYLFPDNDPPSFWRAGYTYNAGVAIPDIGTNSAELLLTLEVDNARQCEIINDLTNDSEAIPVSTGYCFQDFRGDYDNPSCGGVQTWTAVTGRSEGCIRHHGATSYFYYRVLTRR